MPACDRSNLNTSDGEINLIGPLYNLHRRLNGRYTDITRMHRARWMVPLSVCMSACVCAYVHYVGEKERDSMWTHVYVYTSLC